MLHFESLGLIEAEKGIAGGIQAARASERRWPLRWPIIPAK